jgi:pimeloyl-ACP methyl ester carboxylesterase
LGRELTTDTASRGLTEEDIIHIPGLYSRWVRLANGAKAHYVTSGESGPAVILLHGGIEGSSGTAGWRFMAPYLGQRGFRVYCPDQPGFGWSDTSKVEYLARGPWDQVKFLKMFADALGLDKFHLSGNSFGCSNACNFVISHPDRVLSVAFIAGGLGDIVDAPRIPPAEGKFTPNPAYVSPGFDGTEDSMRILMEGIIYKAAAIWPELITMRVKAAGRQRAARQAAGLPITGFGQPADPNMAQILTTKNRLDKLTVPMIYMYGTADVLLPVENGFNQEDATPNIQFFYPDHCGHQGQTDQPDMFNQVFAEFFGTGKVSWKTAEWAGVSRRRAINPDRVEMPSGGFPQPIPEAYKDLATLRAAIGEMAAAPA